MNRTRARRAAAARRLLLACGLLALIGASGYLAYRMGWLFRGSADPVEVARAREAVLTVTNPGTEWPQWRGPARDGRAPAGPFRTDWDKTPPRQLWSVPCGGGFSSCTVVGGKLYTQDRKDNTERVFCVDTTGEAPRVVWEHVYPAAFSEIKGGYANGPRATPTVVGDRVYAVGALGKLVCLDASTGGLKWGHDFASDVPQWGFASSPLVEGDLVLVQPGGKDGAVVAHDRETGAVRWRAGNNPPGYSSPVAATIQGQRLIFALTGDALLALRPDGTIADSFRMKTDHGGNIATPLVVEDYVFVSAAYRTGSALRRVEATGDRVSLVNVYPPQAKFQNHHASSVFKDRYLYGFDGQDPARLKCVEFATGDEKWDAGRDVAKGTLILAGNHLVIQTEGGDLWLVEATPEEFRPVAKVPGVLSGRQNWATPVLVDGRLYLRDEQKVVCLDVRP